MKGAWITHMLIAFLKRVVHTLGGVGNGKKKDGIPENK